MPDQLTEMEKAMRDLRDADAKIINLMADLAAVKKAKDESDAEIRVLNKHLADANVKLDQEISKHQDPAETLLKNMNPQVREAYLAEKAENARLKKRLDEDDDRRAIADIEKAISLDMADLPVKPSELAPVLKAAKSKLSAEESETLDRVLKAGSAALKEAKTVYGRIMGVAKTSTETAVEKRAREKAAADGTTFEKAYAAILKAEPQLYSAIMAEQAN